VERMIHVEKKAFADIETRLLGPVAVSLPLPHVSTLTGRVAERVPQPFNGRVDAVIEFDNRIAGPELTLDFLA
jgi:hypothetical protein